jgi:hypothetical protein
MSTSAAQTSDQKPNGAINWGRTEKNCTVSPCRVAREGRVRGHPVKVSLPRLRRVYRSFFTPKALDSKARGQRSRKAAQRHPGCVLPSHRLRRRRYTTNPTARSFLSNAFGVRGGAWGDPGCAAARRPWASESNAFGVGNIEEKADLQSEFLNALGER